jgi:ATP-dependent protease HslVU (ClpYQ) peptidase subunit
MTCIVGYVDNGIVYIGGDSAGSTDEIIRERVDKKVFRVQDFLIGFTTSFRMGQLLQHKLKVPKQKCKSDFKFMCTVFIDSVKMVFKEDNMKGNFLVGYRGVLYDIEEDFQVAMVAEKYNAVGSGSQYALGALHALVDTLGDDESPITIVTAALEASARFNPFVQGPFIVESI